MDVEATQSSPFATAAETTAVGVFEGEQAAIDLPGAPIERLLESGEASAAATHVAVGHTNGRRLLVVGLGKRMRFDAEGARVAAAKAAVRAHEIGSRTLCWELPDGSGDDIAGGLVEGTILRTYRFERYKPRFRGRALERLIINAQRDLAAPVQRAANITLAQNRARDLGNTPANDLTPVALAGYAQDLAARHQGVTVNVLGETAIREAGMGAFAAVAQGSASEAQLIELDYEGPESSGSPLLALVGKGITFDSGGLSLKPRTSMIEMKFDMSGAAAVIERGGALSELEAPVRVRAIAGATENLPGGRAVKPGDIVRALDGTTIEINNTDAEGRLVLADCLCYVRRQGCDRIVDLATLTNIDMALGSTYAAVMANDDEWAARILESGERTGELLWRMPLHAEYAAMVSGRYAQLTNRTERREAMPLTAAEFLHHFVGETPWAHLDIAGTAFDVPRPYFAGKGATGFGVRLLVELALGLAS